MAHIMLVRSREVYQERLERIYSTGEPRTIGKPRELHGMRKDGSDFPLDPTLAA